MHLELRLLKGSQKSNPGKRVLSIDSDPSCQRLLRASLHTLGCQVEVISASAARSESIPLEELDLVICDADGEPGFWKEILQRIRRQKVGTQMILVSQQYTESEWIEALQVGVYDVLTKPYSPNEIVRIATNALAFEYGQKFRSV
ncbi:MAG: response regulator [Acidobacteriota bacterium]